MKQVSSLPPLNLFFQALKHITVLEGNLFDPFQALELGIWRLGLTAPK